MTPDTNMITRLIDNPNQQPVNTAQQADLRNTQVPAQSNPPVIVRNGVITIGESPFNTRSSQPNFPIMVPIRRPDGSIVDLSSAPERINLEQITQRAQELETRETQQTHQYVPSFGGNLYVPTEYF